MGFTFMDWSTVRILDISAFGPYIGSPSMAFSATSSTLMIEASVSDSAERVGALEPSAAAGGTGKSERMRLLVIVRVVGTTCGI